MANGIEVAQAFVTIIPSMQGSQKAIAEELNADVVGKKAGSDLSEGISSGISAKKVAIGTMLGNVMTSAVSKAGDLISSAVGGVFEGSKAYEQLAGGMEKLFGDSASTVMANADKAFMTAGKSANDYMETVTSFSAALVNSVGGDTAEAARLADVAMQAMSDNVNTFGTDAQSVQNAIQGLAKGNYSMLDNLSLGFFAGTQQGMVDLINASGVLDTELTNTSQLADVGFGTMIEAIQAVQENMGIAGTTAKEAMGTIEGSITAAQSAWDNVLTAVGSGDAEQLASAASGLVDAVFGAIDSETGQREGGVIENVMGLAQRAFETLGGAIPDLVSGALSQLPDSIGGPIGEALDGIASFVTEKGPEIKEAAGDALGKAFDTAVPLIGSAVTTIQSVIKKVSGFIEANVLPVAQSVYDTIAPVVGDIASTISDNMPAIQQTIDSAMGAVGDLVADVWPDVSATIQTASELIAGAIEAAWPVVQKVMTKILEIVQAVWPVVATIIRKAVATIRQVIGTIGTIVGKVKTTFAKVRDAIKAPIESAKKAVTDAIAKIKSIVNGAHLSLPHFKLPHFRINGGKLPWGIGGKGTAPSINVDWYAKGGWVDGPKLFGAGEKGGEFIWPSYQPYLDRYADALADRMGGTGGVNVYLTYNGSGDADELVGRLTRDLRMMRMTGAI